MKEPRPPERPTLWADGVTKKDRLFLWHVAYRTAPERPIDADAVLDACKVRRYPVERALELVGTPAWQRMLQKRHARLTGTPDPHATPEKVAVALRMHFKRHPRRLKKLQRQGVPL